METTKTTTEVLNEFTKKVTSLVDEETNKTLNLEDNEYNKGFRKASFEITGKLDELLSEIKSIKVNDSKESYNSLLAELLGIDPNNSDDVDIEVYSNLGDDDSSTDTSKPAKLENTGSKIFKVRIILTKDYTGNTEGSSIFLDYPLPASMYDLEPSDIIKALLLDAYENSQGFLFDPDEVSIYNIKKFDSLYYHSRTKIYDPATTDEDDLIFTTESGAKFNANGESLKVSNSKPKSDDTPTDKNSDTDDDNKEEDAK